MNFLKRTKTRIFSGGGLLLALIYSSLIGVGFSSWITASISTPDPININASIGNLKNTDFFTIDNVNMFSLGPDGMVEDYTIVSSSKIEAVFNIDNSLAHLCLVDGSLSFEVQLTCSDSSFLSTYISSPTIDDLTSVDTSISGTNMISRFNYSISSNTGVTQINVVYVVTDKTNSDGKSMADLYYSNKPTFSFLVRSSLQ